MCGIAGFYSFSGAIDPRIEPYFSKALAHRGRDGEGVYRAETQKGGEILLVHRRLSILDLEHGAQPLIADTFKKDHLIASVNGEIYNDRALRSLYPSFPFKTHSDCEVLLPLYQDKGISFIKDLRGMYGLALYDSVLDRLILARDPFGIKPLYYRQTETGFAFASEVKALLFPWENLPELDHTSQEEVLNLQFSCGRKTLFSKVYRLLPGEVLDVKHGIIQETLYIPALNKEKYVKTIHESLKAFETCLLDTLQVHLHADVPVGIFYSGGVDSSVILKGLNQLGYETFPAFHLSFEGQEEGLPKNSSLKADLQEVLLTEEDFWRLLPLAAFVMDDFAADYAIIPTLKLSEAAQYQGLKVILSGEGGDEIFAGYGRYKKVLRSRFFGGRALREKSLLHGMNLLKPSLLWRQALSITEEDLSHDGTLSRLQKSQFLDISEWLPNDLMLKLDRALMWFGIEGRPPFLDLWLGNFGFFLKDSLKIKGRYGKWLLKEWLLKGDFSLDCFSKKKGFTPPIARWIGGKSAFLGEYLVRQACLKELCFEESIKKLFNRLQDNPTLKKEAMAGWILLFYVLWHKIHVEKVSFTKSVFELLSEKS